MLIDCDTCAARNIACGDCVVAVLLGSRSDPIELDSAEESALGAFACGGLLPPLRLVPAYRNEPHHGAGHPASRALDGHPAAGETGGNRTAIA